MSNAALTAATTYKLTATKDADGIKSTVTERFTKWSAMNEACKAFNRAGYAFSVVRT